ncbi:unnamed protein product [Linum tenue]|uniref:S-protein homolog n=2 Tax=Linum TaxID=4005 RepID=A0AAV0IK41_9ROSI|nr:unnamed protein product [Linum tenue]
MVISTKLRAGVVLAAALLVMAARPSISSTDASVYIENSLPTSEVTARCQSRDDDIGRHDIAVGDSISWGFGDNGWSETLFWCDLNATDYGVLSFDAYKGHEAGVLYYHYVWFVEEDGVHVRNQYGIVEPLPTKSWGN